MGRSGEREAIGSHDLPIGRMLNDAISKNAQHPLVVFVDLNLPWEAAEPLLEFQPPKPPHPFIHGTVDRIRERHSGLDPINLLVVTNQPSHYTADEERALNPQLLSLISLRPLKAIQRSEVLKAIHDAASLAARFPTIFPKQRS